MLNIFLHTNHKNIQIANKSLWKIAFEDDGEKIDLVDSELVRKLLIDLCKVSIDYPLAFFQV
jgi:hypothetical protein